ncbi:MAG: hypothetical protein QF785_06700, partial [Phycisphaeraceae bacterium]|nr:hypothetical protein [Phycisphaeraceae bacterium]
LKQRLYRLLDHAIHLRLRVQPLLAILGHTDMIGSMAHGAPKTVNSYHICLVNDRVVAAGW